MLKTATAAAAALLAWNSFATDIDFHSDGRFSIGETEFRILAYNSRWHGIDNRKWLQKQQTSSGDTRTVNGFLLTEGHKAAVKQSITTLPDKRHSLSASVRFESQVELKQLCAELNTPIHKADISIDGVPLAIPEKFDKQILYSGKPRQISVAVLGIYSLLIDNLGELRIQDNRKFNTNTLSLRFGFSPQSGAITQSAIKLEFQLRKSNTTEVDTSSVVNRALRDQVAGDGKGGWTDQGPDNDLAAFTLSNLDVLGIPFSIPNAKDHSRNSIIAVAGGERGGFPLEIRLPVAKYSNMRAVNLLHSSAWTPGGKFGELEFIMADGSRQKLDVSGMNDCGDWVNPRGKDNAHVAWKIERIGSDIGIFASSFPLPKQTVESLVFRITNPRAVWLILGITLSEKPAVFPDSGMRESRITMNKEWIKLDFQNHTIPGSALDFSSLIDAPAGKYGFVTVNDKGTLSFQNAPGKRLRLHGINLCQTANFPPKEEADAIAESFTKMGFNSVRIHHHDNYFPKKDSPGTLDFDPETLDRLDYFFAACKRRGLYITTDFYTSRVFRTGDNIPGSANIHPKSLFPVSEQAMQNWRDFTRKWMTHVNPYTGMSWAEDPALVAVNLVNEDNLTRMWNSSLASRDLYAKHFETWKRANQRPNAKADNGDRDFLRFLCETQNRGLAEMSRFVKEDLKLKAPVTSLNHRYESFLTPMRSHFDLVDNHAYFSHPSFINKNWQLPSAHKQDSAISGMASLPRTMMPTRVSGKPFIVTEYNYCRPNHFRAEGGPLLGAYAALQDWDGVYRFCYSHNIKRIQSPTRATGNFESVNDPLMQLSDRIVASLFLRGDAAPAKKLHSIPVPADPSAPDTQLSFPSQFQVLGLIDRIGSHVVGSPLPDNAVSTGNAPSPDAIDDTNTAQKWKKALDDKIAVSSTGQLTLDANNNTFIVNTPLTEALTLPKGQLSTGGILAVSDADSFQTLAAISLDQLPLKNSRRILIIHLSDIVNSNVTFGDSAHTILKDLGDLPLLLRRARAKVTLSLEPGNTPSLQALNADGKNLGTVQLSQNANTWSFTADNSAIPGGVMAYELTRK